MASPSLTSYRLRKFRKLMGYSQREAARIVGVSPGRLSEWERGVRMPSVQNLFKLSILYRTLSDDLYLDLRQELVREIGKKIKKLEVVSKAATDKPP